MRDLFLEDRGLEMTRTGDPATGGFGAAGGVSAAPGPSSGAPGRYPAAGRHVCPFCGSVNDSIEGPCPRCTMENTAETRKATKSRIGPWYVLQSRNPAAPGMRFDTLLGFVRKGRVKARSIVRGPTTHQLWRFACQVKGLSREFGVCFSCGGTIDRSAPVCPQCNRLQDPPADPDVFLEGMAGISAPPAGLMDGAATDAAVALGPSITLSQVGPPAVETAGAEIPVFKELKIPAAAGDAPAAPAAAPTPAPAPQTPKSDAAPSHNPTQPAAGRRNAGDVLISAKELAAAFQLHFDADGESDEARSVPTVGFGSSVPGADAPLPWPPRRRRKRRFGRTVLLLLVLAVGGFAVALAVDASLRQRTYDWANAKWASLTGADLYPDLTQPDRATAARPRPATQPTFTVPPRLESTTAIVRTPEAPRRIDSPLPAGTQQPRPTPPAAHEEDDDGAPAPTTTPPSAAARASVVPPPDDLAPRPSPARDAVAASPTTRPQLLPQATSQPAGSPRVVVATQPASAPAPAPAPPAAPRLTLQQAQQKSRTWYFQALDAEAKDDFRTARDLYKKIMDDLPKEVDGQEVWFQDVEARRQYAEKVLGVK